MEPPHRLVSGEPVLRQEGHGLSPKQAADLRSAVERAVAQIRPGEKWKDADFPPGPAALYGRNPPESLAEMPPLGELQELWGRPSEFMDDVPVLMKKEWQVENIRQGRVNNRWLISAINIVSSNTEQLMRAFLDPTKASAGGRVAAKERSEVHSFGQQHGIYACRFYVDDPLSDDDWAVVLVDDRLPLSELDGLPVFASHPDPCVYWGCILEKAAAKLAGSYAQLRSGTVVQGLKLLTGGHVPSPPRLNGEEGKALIPPSPTPYALWDTIMDRISTNHVVGAAHAAKEGGALTAEADAAVEAAERLGIVARRAYAVVASGEAMGLKLLKLRLPLAPKAEELERIAAGRPSEWVGRFSDDSDAWTSQLRKMLAYTHNANDATFWMLYEDFCVYFNKVYFARLADDVWSKFTVQSQWKGGSAGGSPDFDSWHANEQWLLTVTKRPVRVFITLTQADANKPAGNGRGSATAIGLTVAKGNGGADVRRRKLTLSEGDTVATAGSKFAQQVEVEVFLEPSLVPYVIVPFAHAPGIEGAFKLTVRADDLDDDGVPEFELKAINKKDDWPHLLDEVSEPDTAPEESVTAIAVGRDEHACEYCAAPAVMYDVMAKIDEIERKTARVAMLERQFVEQGLECYAGKDADCGPGWDEFNAQRVQLEGTMLLVDDVRVEAATKATATERRKAEVTAERQLLEFYEQAEREKAAAVESARREEREVAKHEAERTRAANFAASTKTKNKKSAVCIVQ